MYTGRPVGETWNPLERVHVTSTVSMRLAEAAKGDAPPTELKDVILEPYLDFPVSPVEQKELNDFLNENLSSSHIHPSKSPMASLVFFVKKKDGKLRFVQDY